MEMRPHWKIIKSQRQLREERNSKYNLNFPPLQSVSSKTSKAYRNETTSTKTTKSTNLDKTPSRKLSTKIRKVTPNIDEVKIIKVPKVTKECEDEMLTVSSSSYEGYFSSSDSKEEVSTDTSTKSNQSEKTIYTFKTSEY